MRATRTCQFCWQPFDADVSEEGLGQEVCGPCDVAFDRWLDEKIAEFHEEIVAHALNRSVAARKLSESVLATIDGLDGAA